MSTLMPYNPPTLVREEPSTANSNPSQRAPRERKGEEKGYFAFGGSSVAVLFKKGRVEFDADLLENTVNGFETYARVSERMGRAHDQG